MAVSINRLVFLAVIFIIVLTGFGSAVRIVTDPQPLVNTTETLNISCITNVPLYKRKSIISIEVMKQNEDTIAVINMRHELKRGAGMKDNMKAEGHVDMADANQSQLTLIIDKPSRQDAGVYRCLVYFLDEQSKIAEESVIGNVSYEGCPDGWTLYEPDHTCIKKFGGIDDLLNYGSDWFQGRRKCQKHGGDLIQIRDEHKKMFAYNMYEGQHDFYPSPWIGMRDHGKNGTYDFKYVDGSDLDDSSYQPWYKSYPQNGPGTCVGMLAYEQTTGEWFDQDCYHPLPSLCSKSSQFDF